MSNKTKKREYAPNQLVGLVMQTDFWRDPHHQLQRASMLVRWQDGTEGTMPMPIIAKPGDRFVFTIEPL